MPSSGRRGGCGAESWHGAASHSGRTSAPRLTTATLAAGLLHQNQPWGAMSSSTFPAPTPWLLCALQGCEAGLVPGGLSGGCVGPGWVLRVPHFERVPGLLPASAQTVPIPGRQPALAVIQASQWSPSIFKVLGILWLNIGAPGLGCCGEGQSTLACLI